MVRSWANKERCHLHILIKYSRPTALMFYAMITYFSSSRISIYRSAHQPFDLLYTPTYINNECTLSIPSVPRQVPIIMRAIFRKIQYWTSWAFTTTKFVFSSLRRRRPNLPLYSPEFVSMKRKIIHSVKREMIFKCAIFLSSEDLHWTLWKLLLDSGNCCWSFYAHSHLPLALLPALWQHRTYNHHRRPELRVINLDDSCPRPVFASELVASSTQSWCWWWWCCCFCCCPWCGK